MTNVQSPRDSSSITHRRRRFGRSPFAGMVLAAALVATIDGCSCKSIQLAKAIVRPLSPRPADFTIPGYDLPAYAGSGRALAGAARVEITPPPGYPNGGDGPAGGIARGTWTKLYARAVYLEDAARHQIVLVSCDLFAVPESLRAEAARIYDTELASKSGESPLPPLVPESIVLAATHTHQGPGNFLASATLNMFGSPYSGFDKKLFDHLARGVARAIADAARDAKGHAGDHATVRVYSARAYADERGSYLRNRAPQAFDLNPERDELMAAISPIPASDDCRNLRRCLCKDGTVDPNRHDGERCEPLAFWASTGCPRLRAVDPRLTLLDVRRGTGAGARRIALLVFFAAHPTVLLPDSPLYSSDFAGIAVSGLERKWAGTGGGPVVAFFNGAEGDITTRRIARDVRETRRIAGKLAASVEAVLAQGPSPDEEITISTATTDAVVYRRDEHGNARARCSFDHPETSMTLARNPQFGVAGIGGAEDDRTILYDLGWREDVRGPPADGQGPKFPGLDVSIARGIHITQILAPPESFPSHLPMTYAKIASLEVGAIPVEMTTGMAFRIRRTLGLPDDRFVFVGLANEYADYCASPDEYMAQEYVGASTLWGPNEGPVIGCALRELRSAPPRPPESSVPKMKVHPGGRPPEAFGYAFLGEGRNAPDEELGKILRDRDDVPARKLPWTTWDVALASDAETVATPPWIIEVFEESGGSWKARKTPDGDVDDNGGFDLVTMLMDPGSRKKEAPRPRRWAAIWIAPILDEPAPDGRFVIRIAGDGTERCSAPFPVFHGATASPFHDAAGDCPAGLPPVPGADASTVSGGAS